MDTSIKTVQKLRLAFEPYRVIFRHTKGKKDAAPKNRKEAKEPQSLCFGGIANYSPIFALFHGFVT